MTYNKSATFVKMRWLIFKENTLCKYTYILIISNLDNKILIGIGTMFMLIGACLC